MKLKGLAKAPKSSRDYHHFLTIALGSASEWRHLAGLAVRLYFLRVQWRLASTEGVTSRREVCSG
jgi:hypothetical protein